MVLFSEGPMSGWVIEVVGGRDAGGGVRVSCLLGVKAVVVVLLSLLVDFLALLFLVWGLGAMFALTGWVEKKFTSRRREGDRFTAGSFGVDLCRSV